MPRQHHLNTCCGYIQPYPAASLPAVFPFPVPQSGALPARTPDTEFQLVSKAHQLSALPKEQITAARTSATGSKPACGGGGRSFADGGGPMHVIQGATAITSGVPLLNLHSPPFRFWTDELLWSQGRAAVALVEQVFADAGGVRTGGPSRLPLLSNTTAAASQSGQLGASHPLEWELLWSKSVYAFKAAQFLRPGQQVSGLAGLNCLTMKKRMLQTLRHAYGADTAFASLTPRSFALPEELDEWRAWLQQRQQHKQLQKTQTVPIHPISSTMQQAAVGGESSLKSGGGELWMLKTGQDAGKGLQLLPAGQAVAMAEHRCSVMHAPSKRGHQLQVAQQYIAQPLLIEGYKFHLRLWVTVTNHSPLTAALHSCGLVLFSSQPYDLASAASTAVHTSHSGTSSISTTADSSPMEGGARGAGSSSGSISGSMHSTWGDPPAGHITNYACNTDGRVWDLVQLRQHLGSSVFDALWARLVHVTAAIIAAARPSLQAATAWLKPAIPTYGFQMLGLDYLLDQELLPWLLEVNSSPSVMVAHADPSTCNLIHATKRQMLADMLQLIQHRLHPPLQPEDTVHRHSPHGKARSSSQGGLGLVAQHGQQAEEGFADDVHKLATRTVAGITGSRQMSVPGQPALVGLLGSETAAASSLYKVGTRGLQGAKGVGTRGDGLHRQSKELPAWARYRDSGGVVQLETFMPALTCK